jgi:nicotinamide-nucleotide amidase
MIAAASNSGSRADDATLRALAEAALRALQQRHWRVALAESCTGGWVAKALTDIPGSSRNFVGGFVSYDNDLKHSQLGVDAALLAAPGAVSREVVLAMARGARQRTGASLAIAVSGIAGPDGGSADKPVGTVWFGSETPAGPAAEMQLFGGDRELIRRAAVAHALQWIARLAGGAPAS